VLLQLITGNGTFEATDDYRGFDSHEDVVIDGRNDDGLADSVVADNMMGEVRIGWESKACV
jgi:hypothetical protein